MADEKTINIGDDEQEVEVTFETEGSEEGQEKAASQEAPKTQKKPERASEDDDDELASYSESVKRRINRLTFKARENERQLTEAVSVAQRLMEENKLLKAGRLQADKTITTEYENRVKIQEKFLDEQLQEAIQVGDAKRQTELQKELASLAVEKERIRVAKGSIERAEKEAPQEEQRRQQPRQQQQEQQRPQPDQKAQDWAARNEWFGQDAAMTQTVFQIHNHLVAEEGFDPRTDDYYQEVDRRMRAAFPSKFKREARSEDSSERRTTTQTVAGARTSSQPTAKPSKSVKLSPSQVAIARKLGVSIEDYARHYAKLNS